MQVFIDSGTRGMVAYVISSMHHTPSNLAKFLEPYRTGWVALNRAETKILAHTDTFAAINDKIKGYSPDEVILSPVFRADAYFVGCNG